MMPSPAGTCSRCGETVFKNCTGQISPHRCPSRSPKHTFRKRADGRPECICMRLADHPLHIPADPTPGPTEEKR
jgi:hypothetical protein